MKKQKEAQEIVSRDASYAVSKRAVRIGDYSYDWVSSFNGNIAIAQVEGKFGLINSQGTALGQFHYDRIRPFYGDYAMVERDGKWGHIDRNGSEVIPTIYDDVFIFYEGLAIAKYGGKWGFINNKNQTVLPFEYDQVEYFIGGKAKVKKDGKWGYIDPQGTALTPFRYDKIGFYHQGLAKVERNGKKGFINRRGEEVIPAKYDQIGRFRDSLAIVKIGEQYGFINQSGSELIPVKYQAVSGFNDGMAKVTLGGKVGIIDRSNQVIIPPIYDDIEQLSGGIAKVKYNGRWIYIDEEQQSIDPMGLGYAARIKLNDRWGYIDRFGNILGFEADGISFLKTEIQLGPEDTGNNALRRYQFKNTGPVARKIEKIRMPCDCSLIDYTTDWVRTGKSGFIEINCPVPEGQDKYQRNIQVSFSGDALDRTLQLKADLPATDPLSAAGKFVYLVDISGSMDELPLVKMVFSRMAGGLCRSDNISVVSFNSTATVELTPGRDHHRAAETIQNMQPGNLTDAASGLKKSLAIMHERGDYDKKVIYMASDGDIDSARLWQIFASRDDPAIQLELIIFSYNGDQEPYRALRRKINGLGIKVHYVDRENISAFLEGFQPQNGCAEEQPITRSGYDSTRLIDDGLYAVQLGEKWGIMDELGNEILPPDFTEIDHQGSSLYMVRGAGGVSLYNGCRKLNMVDYDSIGNFAFGRAVALRNGMKVIIDEQAREYDFNSSTYNNPLYSDATILQGLPHNNLVLLLDISSSMKAEEKLPMLQTTFKFFTGILRSDDFVSIVSYTDLARIELPSTSAARSNEIIRALESLESRGGTDVVRGLQLALQNALKNFQPKGNNRVILATDGMFEMTGELQETLERYRLHGVHLSVFLFGKKESGKFARNLRDLAEQAAGSYHHITADNIKQALLEEVKANL